MRLIFAISLLLVTFGGSAAGQDRFLIPRGPHWTAAELRAVHGPSQERELQLLVTLASDQDVAERTSILALGPDYVSVVSESGQTIIDTKLRRLLQVDRKAGGFRNTSLYASVDFVQHLLEERTRLRETMTGAGVGEVPDALKAFWIESHLGAESNRKAPLDLVQIDHEDGSASVLFEGEVVAIWQWSSVEITPERQRKFQLYLQYHLKLHPRIRQAILAKQRLPSRIRYKRLKGETSVEEDYRFQVSQRRPAAYPLAADLEPLPEIRPGEDFLREVYPLMLAAASGRHAEAPKTIDGYISDVRAAMDRGAMAEAWLTLMEATLHFQPGSPACAAGSPASAACIDGRVVQDVILRDESVGNLQAALALQLRGEQSERMFGQLYEASRKGLPKGYVIDVFLGNAASQRPGLAQEYGLDAVKLIAGGIRENPYVPAFYKDLGDHFARNLDFVRAYHCYDLGRALPDGAGHESLRLVSKRERELELAFPEFF